MSKKSVVAATPRHLIGTIPAFADALDFHR